MTHVYEQDFYGWTQQQARLLRHGQLVDLDIKRLLCLPQGPPFSSARNRSIGSLFS